MSSALPWFTLWARETLRSNLTSRPGRALGASWALWPCDPLWPRDPLRAGDSLRTRDPLWSRLTLRSLLTLGTLRPLWSCHPSTLRDDRLTDPSALSVDHLTLTDAHSCGVDLFTADVYRVLGEVRGARALSPLSAERATDAHARRHLEPVLYLNSEKERLIWGQVSSIRI